MDNLGIHVLRLKNEDLSDMKKALQTIEDYIKSIK
jgi:hypothetical protein